ncbi:hypothetical protein TUM20286_41000 [Pseudomonas tohonis]|uniref:Uncharacterized protein n=1 Tax=Pseudomonas tohonis TaxID=2725477 RepID=A0ABQ4W4G8_9PSED|nr:hypothetical protein TUM20286_41000 [Pseudomonas tohonis]
MSSWSTGWRAYHTAGAAAPTTASPAMNPRLENLIVTPASVSATPIQLEREALKQIYRRRDAKFPTATLVPP